MSSDQDSKDLELAALIKEIADLHERERKHHAERAVEHGYARDMFRDLDKLTAHLPSGSRDNLRQPLVKYGSVVRAQSQKDNPTFNVSSAAYSIVANTAAVASMGGGYDLVTGRLLPPIRWTTGVADAYAEKLERLDPELGPIYRSVSSAFFGNSEQAERIALFQTRQLFDHLFSVLAPDDQVRASPFFSAKPPPKDKQVFRIERIRYAAHTRTKDKERSEYLVAQANTMLKTYDELQRAHERKTLARESVRQTVGAMKASIEGWVDALEL